MNDHQKKPGVKSKTPREFLPIDQETRSHVSTACAAFHLNRKQETLRLWACFPSTAPNKLTPVRINGRLAWPVEEIRRLLSVGGGK
ncbi:MAG TPA: hypothetical protein VFF81_01755 [Noviherbaspirillum sp.]|nr:hypothetical protein [Noviherbaspirillum sp.]